MTVRLHGLWTGSKEPARALSSISRSASAGTEALEAARGLTVEEIESSLSIVRGVSAHKLPAGPRRHIPSSLILPLPPRNSFLPIFFFPPPPTLPPNISR